MPDYYGNVAQAGAYMINSFADYKAKQAELDMKRQMQEREIAAQEKAQAAKQSGDMAFSGNDPISRGARIQMAHVGVFNAYTDNLLEIENKMNALQKKSEQQGYWDDESSMEMKRLGQYYKNNQTAFSLLSATANSGKFKYTKSDPDGGQLEAEFGSMRDFETWKAARSGETQAAADAKDNSIKKSIFPMLGKAQEQAASGGSGTSEPEPVPSKKADLPDGFVPSEEETSNKQAEVNDIKRELAKKMAQRDAELKNTGYRPNVVVGAAGAGMATSARSARSSDKDRAARVRNLDKEIEKLRSRAGGSGG